MGLVVDEAIARATPCHGYMINSEFIGWSPGVIGTLTDEQETVYCNPKRVESETPEKLERRIKGFKEAANACQARIRGIPKGERLKPWLECMSKELEKRGIQV